MLPAHNEEVLLAQTVREIVDGMRDRTETNEVLVVGSKRAPGADDQRSVARRAVTWGFATLLRGLFRLRVSDTHGVKALRRAAVLPPVEACRFDRDIFDTELVIRAERAGLGVEEIPVTVTERRPSRTSIVRRVPRTLMGLFVLRRAMQREHRAR